MVVLGGLKDNEQAKELLRVYLRDARLEHVDDELLPFEGGAVEVLRDVSDGRPGILLDRAHGLINAAAEQALPTITGTFARQFFYGQVLSGDAADQTEPSAIGDDIDDLLLGGR